MSNTNSDRVNVVDNSIKWMQLSNKIKIIAVIVVFVILFVIILSSTLTLPSHHEPDKSSELATDPVDCNDKLPYGPISSTLVATQLIDICHNAYYAKFDPLAKIPLFTTYIINNQTIAGCETQKTPTYSRDPTTTPDQSAKKIDYQGSGYDHGHMAPASDLAYNKNVLYESYYYTNLAPQLPSLNRGVWETLESSIRYWVFNKSSRVLIIMGTYYTNTSSKLNGRVVIPDKFFKIIIDTNNLFQIYAFSFPQKGQRQGQRQGQTSTNISDYQVSVSQIEKDYKITIPIRDSVNRNAVNNFIVPSQTAYQEYKNNKCKNTV